MEATELVFVLQQAPRAVHEWALLAGAVFIAIKESPRALSVIFDFWLWAKRHILLREEWERIKHLYDIWNKPDND